MNDLRNLITQPKEVAPKAAYPDTGNPLGEVNSAPITTGTLTGFQDPDPLREKRAELETAARNQTPSITIEALSSGSDQSRETNVVPDSNQSIMGNSTPTAIIAKRNLAKAA